jgi:hypothetical protein
MSDTQITSDNEEELSRNIEKFTRNFQNFTNAISTYVNYIILFVPFCFDKLFNTKLEEKVAKTIGIRSSNTLTARLNVKIHTSRSRSRRRHHRR